MAICKNTSVIEQANVYELQFSCLFGAFAFRYFCSKKYLLVHLGISATKKYLLVHYAAKRYFLYYCFFGIYHFFHSNAFLYYITLFITLSLLSLHLPHPHRLHKLQGLLLRPFPDLCEDQYLYFLQFQGPLL